MGMGNPQERLIWLAGFMDGESYLGIKRLQRRGNYGCGFQLLPRVVITNTSGAGISAVTAILQDHNINHELRFKKREQPQHNPCASIEVSSMKPVRHLLNLVSPYLVVKVAQATVLRAFCERRLLVYNAPYSNQDIGDWQKIKELNQNPQRLYAGLLEEAEDIVRAAVKAAEADRNVQPLLFGAE